ncbi:hypothetical protein [Aulosira sp. FACHB-615]|nr:hypothetical protein [Aulosira sp. FACHB-615]
MMSYGDRTSSYLELAKIRSVQLTKQPPRAIAPRFSASVVLPVE